MKKYDGHCHCGAVQFSVSHPNIEKTMRCDCSMCARKGIVMTPAIVEPDDIEISMEPDALSSYQFGSKTARHYFCKRCGIHTFVETRLNPGCYRINLGCINELEALHLPDEIYPGKEL